jgi:hypothetical protein
MFALIENNAVTQVGDLFTLSSGLFIRPIGSAYESWALTNNAVEVVEGEQKDQRFYWVTFSHYEVSGSTVTRAYTNTPKALEDVTETPEGQAEPVTTTGLKTQWIAQCKAAAGSALAQTDWCVTRKFERNIEIPEAIAAERAKIVADCNAKEAAIAAATTIEELVAVVAPVNTASSSV